MAEPRRTLARAWAWTKRKALWPFVRERRRIAIVFLFLLAVFGYVGRKLVLVQLRPDERIFHVNHYVRDLPAMRGPIRDRNGETLSLSVRRWNVQIDAEALPTKTNDLARVYRKLRDLGICTPERLAETFRLALTSKRPRNKPLVRTEDQEAVRAIEGDRLVSSCVRCDLLSRREYLGGRDFSHLLGVVNGNGEAQSGLEKRFDRELRGREGQILGDKTARGGELRSRRVRRIPPVDGCAVVLTVDQALQRLVGEILDDAMDQYEPDAAWAIVEDVRTGEILAMSSRPDFEPEEYFDLAVDDSPRLWNSAAFQVYEPGSVMKPFTAAAALQEGLVSTNSMLDTTDTLYCGHRLSDHHTLARMTVTQMIALSSNRGASRLAAMLGKARMEAWLRRFGFGSRTGNQIPGEASGILWPHRRWSDLQGIQVGFGQGLSVTGIQLVNAYACLANGGFLMEPHLVKSVCAPDGTVLTNFAPRVVGRPIDAKVARDMAFMLAEVPKAGGTGRRAALPGYGVAGKTGTAQMVVGRAYSKTDYYASFCGFFPVREPRLAILVTIKRPRRTERNPLRLHTGGSVAAPIFARIAAAAANRLMIPTDEQVAAPPEELLPEDGWYEDDVDIPLEDALPYEED